MAMLCKDVMTKQHITENDVHWVGIGCPGLASPKEGIIKVSSNLPFDNTNVKEGLKKYINLDVYVENDANVAALGEVMCGAAKGKNSAVIVTLGTGVGGGIILDGKIFSGAFFGAGEIGHQVIKLEDGEVCGCGRVGCWEQYASATGLIRQAKEAAKNNPTSKMLEIAGGIDGITAKVVFDASQAGDETATQVLDTVGKTFITFKTE